MELNVLKPDAPPTAPALSELQEGHCGMVCEIDAATVDLQRLQVMGVCVGRRVVVVKRGDPMIIRVLGARLGLARELAKNVRITLTENQGCCTK